jgi:murein DD-endopeptidase MepM/ murein hydrolase activator NlpD
MPMPAARMRYWLPSSRGHPDVGGDDYKRMSFVTLPQYMSRTSRVLGLFGLTALVVLSSAAPSSAQAPSNGWTNIDEFGEFARSMTFPLGGENHYSDTWLAPRSSGRRHLGVDMMADKLVPILAPRAGCVTWLNYGGMGGGNMMTLTDDEGWQYRFIHINNDTPGTDDGANPYEWAFTVEADECVAEGQHISYVGDSGNAESSGSHLHFEVISPDGLWINPYHSVYAAEIGNGSGTCSGRAVNPENVPSDSSARGYWLIDSAGRVHTYGAPHHGDLSTIGVETPPASMTATASGDGYWIVDTAGLVHSFGDATFHGDMRGSNLNGPVRRIEPHPNGGGYWLVADDGGVFTFGDASFHGSLGDASINAPIISMTSSPSGDGYWLVAADGGVFTFGDAEFLGSTGGIRLNQPVIDMAVNPTGDGYWLYASDGGVFTFGTINYHGSVPGLRRCDIASSVALRPTDTGSGYWIATQTGEVLTFGDAKHHGDSPDLVVTAEAGEGSEQDHAHVVVVDLAVHHGT